MSRSRQVAQWLKESLGDKVREVRVSQRLVDSPAVVVDPDKFMTASMRRMMRAMKQDSEAARPRQAGFNQPGTSHHGALGRHASAGSGVGWQPWRNKCWTTHGWRQGCWKIHARC